MARHRFLASKSDLRAELADRDRYIAFLERDRDALAGRLETRTNELTRALDALEAEKGRVTVATVGTRDTSDIRDQATVPSGHDVRTLREALGDTELKRQPKPQVVTPIVPIPPREPISLRFAAGHRVVTVTGGAA